jgi:hypothetical protein
VKSSSLKIIVVAGVAIVAAWVAFVPMDRKRIAGDFYLIQWEDFTTYYLAKGRWSNDPAGTIEGTVKSLAWSDRYILIERDPMFGNGPNDWVFVDVESELFSDPMTQSDRDRMVAAFDPDLLSRVVEAGVAWDSLALF